MMDVCLLRQLFFTTFTVKPILLNAFIDIIVLQVRKFLLQVMEELHVGDVARVSRQPRRVHTVAQPTSNMAWPLFFTKTQPDLFTVLLSIYSGTFKTFNTSKQ